MSRLNTYLLSVVGTALLSNLITALITSNAIKKIAVFAGNMILVLTILSPVLHIDEYELKRSVQEIQENVQAFQSELTYNSDETMEHLIIEQCRAYILDKAAALGADLDVDFKIEMQEGLPYPVAVTVEGTYTQNAYVMLSKILEDDLGIPKQKQEWKES